MRAVTFDVTVPRYLLAKSAGRFTNAAVFGAPSGLRLSDVEVPGLPGPDWVRWALIFDYVNLEGVLMKIILPIPPASHFFPFTF